MTSSIRRIETGARSPDGKDCVFLWLYTPDGEPYKKYRAQHEHDKPFPLILALLRWDGTFGTMGGKVDPGESLRQALARESFEEAGFTLADTDQPEILGTFQDGLWHIHSFTLALPFATLVDVRAAASMASKATPECAGFNLVPAAAYLPHPDGYPRGVEAFRENRFCSTAKLEFDLLLEKLLPRHG